MASSHPQPRKYHWGFVASLIIIAGTPMGCGEQETASAHGPVARNVVMIIVDTLRADKMSCYGFPLETSPELDALAAKGVRFESVLAPSSWTKPSVGALLTGMYPRSVGLYRSRTEKMTSEVDTLAEVFQRNGYATYASTANPIINTTFGYGQGFDEYVDSRVIHGFMGPDGDGRNREKTRLASAREIFAGALEYVDNAPEGRTFMMLNIMDVHEAHQKEFSLTRPEFTTLFPEAKDAHYLQSIRQTSLDVNQFISDLVERPGWGDTLFVIVSDHGQGLSDHPAVSESTLHGRHLYDAQVYVPLIFYHTEQRLPQNTIAAPVRLIDVMPTLLEFMDLKSPGGMDGRSLMPMMYDIDTKLDLPEFFVTETYFRGKDKIAVNTNEWVYIENRAESPDLDPRELQPRGLVQNGRATDQLHDNEEVADRLAAWLANWEREHPKAEPTSWEENLSEDDLKMLEDMGYF